jgi:glycosyltransferase involved in cell wall biosynthesis
MAGTSRVKLYARGLSEAGVSTGILVVRGTERAGQMRNEDVRGEHEGICFEYTGGRTVIPRSWIGRRLDEAIGIMQAARRLRLMKHEGLEYALLYTNDLRFIKIFSMMCRQVHIKVVLELCEWPLAKATYLGLNIKTARRFMVEGMPCVDAVLPISNFLKNQIEEYEYAHDCHIPHLQVPIMVDTISFQPLQSRPGGRPSILWCGSLDYTLITKNIVDAACLLRSRGNVNFEIRILGGIGPPDQLRKLQAYVARTFAADVVRIFGFLPEGELRQAYADAAACLVLLQDNDISRSRFPTKLGEFLAMGRPVIASPIGELPGYLLDQETAYFTRNLSAEALADTIEKVLNDRERAEQVGGAGRRLAEDVFDYRNQGRRVAAFLEGMQESHLVRGIRK